MNVEQIEALQEQAITALTTGGLQHSAECILQQLSQCGMQYIAEVYEAVVNIEHAKEPTLTVTSFCSLSELRNVCGMDSDEEAFGLFKHISPSARIAMYGQTKSVEFTITYTQSQLASMGLSHDTIDEEAPSIYEHLQIVQLLANYENMIVSSGYTVGYRSDMSVFVIENDVETLECGTLDVTDDIIQAIIAKQ